ncbi:uncharacterized protein B0H64DRAFT_379191 [Chaetomium fimeti]|uniref:Uncharacterized protein n=1 Tax=Chaetomium fimeti TaxID=1854472 RepID=A0AAE0HNM1_9PEZI|nr:hypothetical protein B0H64DRAFT_379191 [Chaetomium fimeti]
MAKCSRCGNDTKKPRGFEEVTIRCDRCENSSGYRLCPGCTHGPAGLVLVCCGKCNPTGRVKCEICKGSGTRKVKKPCTRKHG